ncbi:hypothetical protein [Rhodococcus sp. HNM0569]|uniref:hypothetical protein n=1 Tax=Rhodococcus sp. HNM0569 TaxID=2716340 RepID=UPI00146DD1B5|nr:hypothetical protein [Rhodococcus sp. HNM0569]NLU83542.1 hypothetical protein [Rhodococcus sp. HNM0569]
MSTAIAVSLTVGTLVMAVATLVATPRGRWSAGEAAARADGTTGPIFQSVCVMDTRELEMLVESLFARERELRASDQVEAAREVGVHKFICISELRSRRA